MVFIDGNENLQSGPLHSLFTDEDLDMVDLIEHRCNQKGPATYAKGHRQIDGAFATRDIICNGARFLPLWSGIGDHRPIVIDIPSECLYGNELLRIERPLARRLQCKFPSCQKKYTNTLEYYLRHHQLPRKIQRLIDLSHQPNSNYAPLQEKIDKQKQNSC